MPAEKIILVDNKKWYQIYIILSGTSVSTHSFIDVSDTDDVEDGSQGATLKFKHAKWNISAEADDTEVILYFFGGNNGDQTILHLGNSADRLVLDIIHPDPDLSNPGCGDVGLIVDPSPATGSGVKGYIIAKGKSVTLPYSSELMKLEILPRNKPIGATNETKSDK